MILELKNVSKVFAVPSVRRETVREHLFALFWPRRVEALSVLESVSFGVERGETLGIMGRNGSGKSTLLRIVAGIYEPSSGTITAGAPITPLLGLGVGWNAELSAIDNVYLLGSVLGMSLRHIDSNIAKMLAFAELERFAHLQIKHFSSGMAARLAYAVAFQAMNEIVLLDEIYAVGDAKFQARCEARCRELVAAGHTVILVSHDPKHIKGFCKRVVLIEGGRVVMDGGPDQVVAGYLELLGRGADVDSTGQALG
jgi:ABC-type polysaccharide/polyol phosphate transport system ATPase subunit